MSPGDSGGDGGKPRYEVVPTGWAQSPLKDRSQAPKQGKLNREIVVPASFGLVRTLMEHDLADELRLFIYPVVVGAGERLFGEAGDRKPMRLVHAQTIGDSLALLTYERAP